MRENRVSAGEGGGEQQVGAVLRPEVLVRRADVRLGLHQLRALPDLQDHEVGVPEGTCCPADPVVAAEIPVAQLSLASDALAHAAFSVALTAVIRSSISTERTA